MKRPLIALVLALCVLAVLAVAGRQDLALMFQHTGRARLATGDAVAAEAAFRRAGTLGGDAASLAYDLGVARYRQGDFTGAQRAFAAAMATSSPAVLAAAQFNRANCGFRKGEALAAGDRQAATRMFREAIADYRSVLSLAPGAADAAANLRLAEARLAALERRADDDRRGARAETKPSASAEADGAGRGDGKGASEPQQASPPRSTAATPPTGSGGSYTGSTAAGAARLELTQGEVDRLLSEARGREQPAGKLHGGTKNQPLAKPEQDW
jgi:tetratricopeptide (TPR) repeat protein